MPTHYAGTEEERRALDVFIKLMRAADAVAERTSSFTEAGLTPGQFGVLETLYHLGPLSISEIARKHLMSRNNFTVIVGNLEKRGLVARERDTCDRRAVRVSLTDTGGALVAQTLPGHVASVVGQMRILTREQQEQLGVLLRLLGRQTPDPTAAAPAHTACTGAQAAGTPSALRDSD